VYLAVCIAKTQKSLSDNEHKKGCPRGFTFKIREVELSSGAGFIVPIAGTIMRMPGLPSNPSAEKIDIDENGVGSRNGSHRTSPPGQNNKFY